jgi:hypothetical protein
MRIKHAVATLAAAAAVGAFVPAASAGGFAPCGIEHPTACTCGYELVLDGKNTHLEPHQC